MLKEAQTLHCIISTIIITLFIVSFSPCTPLLNPYEPQPLYTPQGLDKFYKKRKKFVSFFALSPFYLNGTSARNEKGKKVDGGNRLGNWNQFAIFFNPSKDTTKTYSTWDTAKSDIGTVTKKDIEDGDRYRTETDLTNEINFDPAKDTFAYVTNPIKFEKYGLRGKLGFESKWGLGIALKGGVVDLRHRYQSRQMSYTWQTGTNTYPFLPYVLESQLVTDMKTGSENVQIDATDIYNALFIPSKYDGICKDLDIDNKSYKKTGAEDTHIQLYWQAPISFKDKDDDIALRVVPFFSVGVWAPTGSDLDQNKLFFVSSGNDGFVGISFEGSLAFDFPVWPRKNAFFQAAFGAGVVIYPEKEFNDYRIPTSKYQVGVIPWKTKVEREPGITWYGNISAKGDNFINGLSAFFDFIYTSHEKDNFKLLESNTDRKKVFEDNGSMQEMERRSSWINQQVNIGLEYQIVKNLAIGGAVQAHISGKRVLQTVTVLGGMTFTF